MTEVKSKANFSEVSNSYERAHEVKKGDPKFNGPYLDDIRAEQEAAYRAQREKEINAAAKPAKKTAAKKTTKAQPKKEADASLTGENDGS